MSCNLPSRKLTWKPKKGPIKITFLLMGTTWVSMLAWGSVNTWYPPLITSRGLGFWVGSSQTFALLQRRTKQAIPFSTVPSERPSATKLQRLWIHGSAPHRVHRSHRTQTVMRALMFRKLDAEVGQSYCRPYPGWRGRSCRIEESHRVVRLHWDRFSGPSRTA